MKKRIIGFIVLVAILLPIFAGETVSVQTVSVKEKKYEIDFITVKNKKICPIEVKSSGYTSHKSFDYLVEKYQMKMQDRFIIYTKDLKYQDGILYVPIYMTMCI